MQDIASTLLESQRPGSSANSASAEQVDPFEAQEARPYKQDPDVLAMTNLVSAYQGNNIREFEKILATNRCCSYAASALHRDLSCLWHRLHRLC